MGLFPGFVSLLFGLWLLILLCLTLGDFVVCSSLCLTMSLWWGVDFGCWVCGFSGVLVLIVLL